MSTQLEFIMQLYMMNLLQQQQQQQQQQQTQSFFPMNTVAGGPTTSTSLSPATTNFTTPIKNEMIASSTTPPLLEDDNDNDNDDDNDSNPTTTTTTAATESAESHEQYASAEQRTRIEQQQQQGGYATRLKRAKNCKNNLNNKASNCSSSGRSCSPNSNASLHFSLTPTKTQETATLAAMPAFLESNALVVNNQAAVIAATATEISRQNAMLLNNIPASLTQLMLQQHQQQLLANLTTATTATAQPPSHLLMTPTRPNSNGGNSSAQSSKAALTFDSLTNHPHVSASNLSQFHASSSHMHLALQQATPPTHSHSMLSTSNSNRNNKNNNCSSFLKASASISQTEDLHSLRSNRNNNSNSNNSHSVANVATNSSFIDFVDTVHTTSVNNLSFTAQNFLQSSTVTSTPTEKSQAATSLAIDGNVPNVCPTPTTTIRNLNNGALRKWRKKRQQQNNKSKNKNKNKDKDKDNDNDTLNDLSDSDDNKSVNDEDDEVDEDGAHCEGGNTDDVDNENGNRRLRVNGVNSKNVARDMKNVAASETPVNLDDIDEDDLPLSSLHTTSSGIVSAASTSFTTSGEGHSDLPALESTNDSAMDHSANMPYTPIKQEADSSLSSAPLHLLKSLDFAPTSVEGQQKQTKHLGSARTALNEEDSNATTPLALNNAILTPPSSEQIVQHAYEVRNAKLMSNKLTINLTSSTQFTNECGSGNSQTAATTPTPTPTPTITPILTTTISSLDTFLQNEEENLKYLKKFTSYLECENPLCRQENLREHFHCFSEPCKGKILSKKDDIIRHLKWHKKRKESLLLGFARFSSSDDCAPSYGAGCVYNWKQTHYHCVYDECPKVYVSTSDVQMHANFHRKNSEIVQEGFRRFRAHEDCKIEDCPFYGRKMSHYHCCREGCNHTFKNKADMEKHKSYHMKDYQLTQDGFKKILKTEPCPFEDCKFSTVSNHIHCVRENCNYILHSSSQMISHKRKHDRADTEQAYQTFKCKKESSEDESPSTANVTTTTPPTATTTTTTTTAQNISGSSCGEGEMMTCIEAGGVSTPLSSHQSAESFLSRKRGRPPKMFQLPPDTDESKRIKLETTPPLHSDQNLLNMTNALGNMSAANPANAAAAAAAVAAGSMFPPYIPNFSTAAAAATAAAMQQTLQSQDPTATPNFQMTHLMALFQLQNPLFYQNLYPNMLAAAAGTLPANASMFNNLAAFSAAAAAAAANAGSTNGGGMASIKNEFNEKQPYKE